MSGAARVLRGLLEEDVDEHVASLAPVEHGGREVQEQAPDVLTGGVLPLLGDGVPAGQGVPQGLAEARRGLEPEGAARLGQGRKK